MSETTTTMEVLEQKKLFKDKLNQKLMNFWGSIPSEADVVSVKLQKKNGKYFIKSSITL